MSLLAKWEEIADKERTQEEHDQFWSEYFKKEQKIYQTLLSSNTNTIKGNMTELAEKFGMSTLDFAGYMSGINTSLIKEIDVDALTEDSEIDVVIDFEKLYFNMHVAQADWLYELSEWDGILSKERRKEIKTEYNKSRIVVNENKVGRNDPCPCGSGKKYKKCCGK